jgi:hemoglobin/transferrin/lactoferrin receptor protein
MKKYYLLPFLLFCGKIMGQSDSLKTKNLDEVIFSANKIAENKLAISQQVKVISKKEIENINATTTGDLLANIGAVSLQKSQQGGGSPTIRGFEASRVVLIVDGVRMNNLIYRAGHLQNIVTIDQSVLERAEVLYGPASTIYGSDALGGVIHFYTKNPTLAAIKAGGYFRVRGPNQEKTANAILNLGYKKWASLGSITVSSFNDLKMGTKINPTLGTAFGLRKQYVDNDFTSGFKPDQLISNIDPLIQKYSGYNQIDLFEKILFKPAENLSHILNIQYSTSSNVPRYDRLTDPLNKDGSGLKSAEWYYGPQKRMLTAYDFRKNSSTANFHFGVNYQAVQESRHDRPFNGKFVRNRIEDVNVFGMNTDFSKTKINYEVRYGIEMQYSNLESTANQKSIEKNETKALSTRYPGGKNNFLNFGMYLSESWVLSPKLRITDGIRLGYCSLNSVFSDKTFFPFPYSEASQKNIVYSGNIGLIFTPSNSWKINGMLSTGFRAPNIDDLSKVFESAKGTLIVPNPNLKPEKTINFELGVTKHISNKFYWENTLYKTLFKDAIVTDLFTLNGKSEAIYDGTNSKILANQNKRRANIWGFSSTINAILSEKISASASYNYTKGTIVGLDSKPNTPLDHIPPTFGRFGLKYKLKKLNLEAFMLFNGWKKIGDYLLNGEDNEQYATTKGMPSWKTANVRIQYFFTNEWQLIVGVDNIFDLQYRTFASGINAPGRNIFATLRKGI